MLNGRVLGSIALMAVFSLSVMGCEPKATVERDVPSAVQETTQENTLKQAELKTYISEKYGFSFQYGALTLDDAIDGDQYAKLEDALGNSATVTISKPDSLTGDDPKAWLKKAFTSSDYQMVRREDTALNGYPAVIAEFSWEVLGKPIRTVEWIALKDGYFFQLVVTMKEETVTEAREAFDQVVASFALSKETVDLEAQKPWMEKIPKEYPFEIVDLYGLSELTSVFGTELSASKLVTIIYDIQEDITYEEAVQYFSEALKDAEGYEVSPHTDKTNIEGIKGGFIFDIEVRFYKMASKTTVSIAIKKAN